MGKVVFMYISNLKKVGGDGDVHGMAKHVGVGQFLDVAKCIVVNSSVEI